MKGNFLFVLLTALSMAACTNHSSEDETFSSPVKSEVTVVKPSLNTLSNFIELNATTQYQRKETIRATATGYIGGLTVLPGDNISEGKSICTITTKEQVALKSLDTGVLKSINRPVIISNSAAGVVTQVSYRNGDFVNEGEVIANVAEPSSLMLLLNVPFEYASYVNAGVTCEVILPDGTKSTAYVTQRLPTVDAASQTQSILLKTSKTTLLPENMNVLVHLPHGNKQNALCIVKSAIQTDESQSEFWVMKLVSDSLAVKIPVQIGITQDSLQEIISDKISVNDLIINEGAYGLPDSSLVKVQR